MPCRNFETNPADQGEDDDEEDEEENPGFALHKSFAALTRLSQLVIPNPLPTSCLQPIMGLPALECLSVCVNDCDDGEGVGGLPLQSRRLTRLEVDGDHQTGLLVGFPFEFLG